MEGSTPQRAQPDVPYGNLRYKPHNNARHSSAKDSSKGKIMTYAEEVRAEVQVEIVKGLLRVGVTWDVIASATGLTEANFQELKAQLAESDS